MKDYLKQCPSVAHALPSNLEAIQLLKELGWKPASMSAEIWNEMIVKANESFKFDEDAESWVDGNPPLCTLQHKIWFSGREQADAFSAHIKQRPKLGFKLSSLGAIASDTGFEVQLSSVGLICSAVVTKFMARLVWEARCWNGRYALASVKRHQSKIQVLRIPSPFPPEYRSERAYRLLADAEDEIWLARQVLGPWVQHWRVQPLEQPHASVTDEGKVDDSTVRLWLADCVLTPNAPRIEVLRWTLLQSPDLRKVGETLCRTSEFTGLVQIVDLTSDAPAGFKLGDLIRMQTSVLERSQKVFAQHEALISILRGQAAPSTPQ